MPAISVRDASPNGAEKPDANAASSVVEARPATPADPLERSLHQAVEQVFLSPRVVDQRAFDEFAGQLSKLTKEAGKAGESLAVTHGQVKALNEQLRSLMSDLTSKTDAAIKALPLIEAKSAKVQQLLSHVGNETAIAKARELRDGVAQELLAQRDGLVKQLVAEVREAVVRQAMDDMQTELRDQLAKQLEASMRGQMHDAMTQMMTPLLREAMREHLAALPAPSGPVAAPPVIDTLALDASLKETIVDAQAAIAKFETQVRTVEQRLEHTKLAGEQITQRAEQIEKSLEEAVLRATMKFESTVSQSEQRTEAVASEIAEQLLALRADAAKLVTESREVIAADRASIASERQTAIDTITATSQRLMNRIEQLPVLSDDMIAAKAQAAIESSSREAANALSQLAAEHAVQIESARVEALATIQSAAATAAASNTLRGENVARITTALAAAETPAFSREMLDQLQAATQHASQTHAHVSAIIARLESLAARAEEARVELGERVIAAAQAADVIDERLTRASNLPQPTLSPTSQPSTTQQQLPTRELVGLLHQAQVAGTQLHQLGAWITHLLHASEAMAQRLERAQRITP